MSTERFTAEDDIVRFYRRMFPELYQPVNFEDGEDPNDFDIDCGHTHEEGKTVCEIEYDDDLLYYVHTNPDAHIEHFDGNGDLYKINAATGYLQRFDEESRQFVEEPEEQEWILDPTGTFYYNDENDERHYLPDDEMDYKPSNKRRTPEM